MINFIPLKQSEDMVMLQDLTTVKETKKKGTSFEEIFRNVKNKSETINQSKTVEKSNMLDKNKTIEDKVDNKSDNGEIIDTKMGEIEKRLDAALQDNQIDLEEIKEIVAIIQDLLKLLEKNQDVDLTMNQNQSSEFNKHIKLQNVDIQYFNHFDEETVKKLLVNIKDKFSFSMNKVHSEFSKIKIIDEIIKKFDGAKINYIESEVGIDKNILHDNNRKIDVEKVDLGLKKTIDDNIDNVELSNNMDLDKELNEKNDKNHEINKSFNIDSVKIDHFNRENNRTEIKQIEIRDVRDIIKLVDTIEMAKSQGVKRLTVQLHPEHLGKLEIQLVESGGKINAKIFTDNEQARLLLVNNLEQMRNHLQSKGIHIDNMEFSFMMANEDKGRHSEKENKSSFRFGGSIVEEEKVPNDVKGLYA